MNAKSESHLVNKVDEVILLPVPGIRGKYVVIAKGTANTAASNARLRVSPKPAIGTVLLLDLLAEHQPMSVITEVSAAQVFDLRGFMTVTVRGRENQESRPVPSEGKAGAQAEGESASSDFAQRLWRATHFLNNKAMPEPVLPGSQLTVCFSAEVSGTVQGSGGCNAYGASFVWQPVGSINIHDLGHTLKECEPGIMEQERRFFSHLLEAREIECRGEVLELRAGPGGVGTGIRFELVKPAR